MSEAGPSIEAVFAYGATDVSTNQDTRSRTTMATANTMNGVPLFVLDEADCSWYLSASSRDGCVVPASSAGSGGAGSAWLLGSASIDGPR